MRWLIACALLLYAVVTFEPGAPTWAVGSIAVFAAVLGLQWTRWTMLRAYALWFGAFLVLQALLTPWLRGDLVTLPLRMHATIDVRTSSLPGVPPGIRHVTTDERGFRVSPRIDYEAKSGWRIFAIGGSTTEDIFLDDDSTWTHMLQEELARRGAPVQVINTGVSGLRSPNHLATLRHIVRLEPDLIIFLVGANDWNRQIADRFETRTWKPVSLRYSALGMLVDEALISPVRRRVTGKSWSDQTRIVRGPGDLVRSDQLSIHRRTTHTFRPTRVAEEYGETLREISGVCSENGMTCMFMTQPHAYGPETPAGLRSRFWMTPPWATYTLDLESMNHIASLYNGFLRSFAERQGHPLCDLAAKLEPLPAYFYDDLHFTDEGARRVADLVLPCALQALRAPRLLRSTAPGDPPPAASKASQVSDPAARIRPSS